MPTWLILHAGIGVVGTWLALHYARGRQLLDHPGERRSHDVATPRGGGVAIVAALLVAATALAWRDPGQRSLLVAFVVGLLLVAAIGMIDDHRPLSPWLRLTVHALAALVFAVAVAVAFDSAALAIASAAAVLVLCNIWNFMDGIDGLAASQALLLGVVLTVVADAGSWALVAAAMAAACGGFLPFNFMPSSAQSVRSVRARIFLGDVGSGALGYAIAALAIVVHGRQGASVSLLLLLPLSAFLIDAGLTLLRRLLRGERWWTAHTQHAYQVWARRAGHAPVTLAYAGWTVLAVAVMWLLRGRPVDFILYSGLAWYTSGAALWWILQRMDSGRNNAGQDGPRRANSSQGSSHSSSDPLVDRHRLHRGDR